jgi:hypothetical protein
MKSIRIIAVAVLVLTFAAGASAQFGNMMRPPELRGVFNPVVGEGANYQMVDEKGITRQFEITVVEKDSSGGYWQEMAIQDPKGETVYMKMLLAKQGSDLIIQRSIVQTPGRPPMELTSMMQNQAKPQKLDYRAEAQNLGTESVTTPAGTFSCQHWRTTKENDNADIWINDKVKPWGLVKTSSKSGTLTLTKIITEAKTHITGKPMSMEDMMKGRMGKQ